MLPGWPRLTDRLSALALLGKGLPLLRRSARTDRPDGRPIPKNITVKLSILLYLLTKHTAAGWAALLQYFPPILVQLTCGGFTEILIRSRQIMCPYEGHLLIT